MSQNLYAVFFKDKPEDRLAGAWYMTLQDAVDAYFDEGFQSRHPITSLRMTIVGDNESLEEFDRRIDVIYVAKTPDFFNWITLESKSELPPEEILSRALAEVQSRLGTSSVEIFKSSAKDRAVVRISNEYWNYRVIRQKVLKTRLN